MGPEQVRNARVAVRRFSAWALVEGLAEVDPTPRATRGAIPPPPPPIPRHPQVTRWQAAQRARSIAETTVRARLLNLDRLMRHVDHFDPTTLELDHVVAYLEQALAPATRRAYHAGLVAWFKWLVLQGVRLDNPMLLPTPRVPRTRPRPITNAELERLLRSRMHRRTRAMVLLAAYQGLRACEIARVRGSDLNLSENTFKVVGKGGVDAELPLHQLVREIALHFDGGWWFPQWKANHQSPRGNRPILARSVSSIISRAMDRADVRATAHSLRHWHATTCLPAVWTHASPNS